MNGFQQTLTDFLCTTGISDVGFCSVPQEDLEASGGLPFAVTLVVRLSDAIVEEIGETPTHTYFNHYRTVNALLDQTLLRTGLLLQQQGWRYLTVAASQSINTAGWQYRGRYSHKKAAVRAGLGSIGRNSLFLHRQFGACVRLATLFTDCPLDVTENRSATDDWCAGCGRCVAACPAHAITGEIWHAGVSREALFDPAACSNYMKQHFQHIGRGAVCGICMRVCPGGTGCTRRQAPPEAARPKRTSPAL